MLLQDQPAQCAFSQMSDAARHRLAFLQAAKSANYVLPEKEHLPYDVSRNVRPGPTAWEQSNRRLELRQSGLSNREADAVVQREMSREQQVQLMPTDQFEIMSKLLDRCAPNQRWFDRNDSIASLNLRLLENEQFAASVSRERQRMVAELDAKVAASVAQEAKKVEERSAQDAWLFKK